MRKEKRKKVARFLFLLNAQSKIIIINNFNCEFKDLDMTLVRTGL